MPEQPEWSSAGVPDPQMTALHATDGETDERVGSNNPGPHTWLVLTDAGDPQPPCPIKAAEASSWEPKGNT